MTAIPVTTIDKVSSTSAKQELATLLSEVLVARDSTRQPGDVKHWRFIVRAARWTSSPEGKPERGVSNLAYAAWQAHLAGTRRWTANRHREPSS